MINFQPPLLRPNPITSTVELDSAASSRSPKMIGFFLFARPILGCLFCSLEALRLYPRFGPETRFHSWIWRVYHLHSSPLSYHGIHGQKKSQLVASSCPSFPSCCIQHLQVLKPPTDVHSQATAARWHTTVEARAAWGSLGSLGSLVALARDLLLWLCLKDTSESNGLSSSMNKNAILRVYPCIPYSQTREWPPHPCPDGAAQSTPLQTRCFSHEMSSFLMAKYLKYGEHGKMYSKLTVWPKNVAKNPRFWVETHLPTLFSRLEMWTCWRVTHLFVYQSLVNVSS